MVATPFFADEIQAKWLGYFAISLCLNVLLAHNIHVGLPEFVPAQAARIRVALKSVVLPEQKIATTQKQVLPQSVVPHKKQAKPKMMPKPTVVETAAQQKVALANVAQEAQIVEADTLTQQPLAQQTVEEDKPISEIQPKEILAPADDVQARVADSNIAPAAEQAAEAIDIQSAKPVAIKQAVEQTTVVHEANYRKKTSPAYPRRALELGQQGVVMLHAKVLPSGHPDEIKVVDSSGYRLLDKAALAAVRQWEFIPTDVNGQAIVSWVSVPVNFVIQ